MGIFILEALRNETFNRDRISYYIHIESCLNFQQDGRVNGRTRSVEKLCLNMKHIISNAQSNASSLKIIGILSFKLNYSNNKCNKYRCITQTTTWPLSWGPFSSARKLLLLFCSDLAVLIFTMLLVVIQRPKVGTGSTGYKTPPPSIVLL